MVWAVPTTRLGLRWCGSSQFTWGLSLCNRDLMAASLATLPRWLAPRPGLRC